MKLTFIGAGNMGGAIVRGLLRSGAFTPCDIDIISRNKAIARNFADMGLNTDPDSLGDVVIVAVKPWHLGGVSGLIKDYNGVVISLAASVTITELKTLWGEKRIVRVMPNTAVESLAGVSLITAGAAETAIETAIETADLEQLAADIFAPLGATFIMDEALFEPCMALSSCGLAYALRYSRASISGAVELGIKPAMGQAIFAAVLRGAAALLESGAHPEAEIDKVTTPGGNTIKGLNAMESHGFTTAVIEGLKNSL